MKTKRVTLTLAAAFGVLIVLLVTVGCWGVVHLAKMNRDLQLIVNHRWQKVRLSREALRYSTLNSRITMQIFLLQDQEKIEPLLEQRVKNTEEISELLKTIEAGLESDAEKSLVASIWTNRIPYVNSYQLALDLLLKEAQPEAGRQMMSGVVLTNLIAYHKAWEAFVAYQSGQMDQAAKTADVRYAAARQELITLVVATTLLAAAIALFAVRNLSREITERKRAETALRESEARTRLLVKASNIGLWDWNLVTNEVYFSAEWKSQLGYTDAEISSRLEEWESRLHPEDRAPTFAAVKDYLEGRRADYEMEFRLRHKDGSWRCFLTRANPTRNATGQPVRIMGCHIDITARKLSEAALEQAHKELVTASRQAGVAEAATGILHNVGNVLNSVTIASNCVAASLKKSKAANLSKIVALLREHETDLGAFLTSDPKGRHIPIYLAQLAEYLTVEQASVLKELTELQKNIEHIKEVVTAQQSSVKGAGKSEWLQVADLVEDVLRMDSSGQAQRDIQVIREFEDLPAIVVDKHKVLQILMNLVRNAKQACQEGEQPDKRLTIRVSKGAECVRASVSDNGVGIAPENLARIFAHGFTTKKDGHGFGLHSAALAVKEMGGSLTVHSDGLGRGAVFTLELPLPEAGERP